MPAMMQDTPAHSAASAGTTAPGQKGKASAQPLTGSATSAANRVTSSRRVAQGPQWKHQATGPSRLPNEAPTAGKTPIK